MENYSLLVKNLTCDNYNCMQQLKEQLEKINVHVNNLIPGKIILVNKPHQFRLRKIQVVLRNNGMQLIVNRKQMIAEKIKGLIDNLIFDSHDKIYRNYSVYISETIGINYYDLSRLFSSVMNTTIEKYIISQKIQRIKHLLIYDKLTPAKIAKKLSYSSVQYLYAQFKKIEGETLSSYKKKHTHPPPHYTQFLTM